MWAEVNRQTRKTKSGSSNKQAVLGSLMVPFVQIINAPAELGVRLKKVN